MALREDLRAAVERFDGWAKSFPRYAPRLSRTTRGFPSIMPPYSDYDREQWSSADAQFRAECAALLPLLEAAGVQLAPTLRRPPRTEFSPTRGAPAGEILTWSLADDNPLWPRPPSNAFGLAARAIEKLLRDTYAVGGQEQTVTQPTCRDESEPSTGKADAPDLTEEDLTILIYLNERRPALQLLSDIEAGAPVSRHTAGKRVNRLVECGILHRPEGERRGVGLTSKGIELVKALPIAGR